MNICKVGSKVSSVNLLEDDSYNVFGDTINYSYTTTSSLFLFISVIWCCIIFILLTVNLLNKN